MEGTFNSIEQFEQVLYKTVEKAGEITLVKFMANFVSSEDKNKIKELYGVEKTGSKIIEILEDNPEKYYFTSREDPNKNNWCFKIAETKNTQKESKKDSVEHINEENKATGKNLISNKEKKTLKIAKESDELLDDSDILPSSEDEEMEFQVDEKLKKLVTKNMVLINDTFYISKFLVTQELYESVMGENPSSFKDNPDPKEKQERRPVETVSYLEAIEFCNKLSEKCGFASCYKNGIYTSEINGFRLPTENEWNFVATAENKNSFIYAGSDVPDGFAWYKHNSKTKTHEVGKKNPVIINDDGIYDMNGNVWEWVMSDSNADKALFIGGSYEDSEDYLELRKPMNKELTDKNTKNSKIGFRICVNSLK